MVDLHMVDTCHLYIGPKLLERTPPRVNPEVNYGLEVTTGQWRVIDCDGSSIVKQDVGRGGGCAGVGQAGIWKLSVLFAQFKTALKKLLI